MCPLVPDMVETPNNLNTLPFGAMIFYYYSNLDWHRLHLPEEERLVMSHKLFRLLLCAANETVSPIFFLNTHQNVFESQPGMTLQPHLQFPFLDKLQTNAPPNLPLGVEEFTSCLQNIEIFLFSTSDSIFFFLTLPASAPPTPMDICGGLPDRLGSDRSYG